MDPLDNNLITITTIITAITRITSTMIKHLVSDIMILIIP